MLLRRTGPVCDDSDRHHVLISCVACTYSSNCLFISRMGPVGTAAHGVPFSRAGLQIAFLDLLRSPGSGSEEVQSLRYLSLPNEGELAEEEVTFVKLLPGVAPTRRLSTSSGSSSSDDNNNDAAAAHDASASKGVLVVLGTASGRTYFWDVSPFTPAAISKVCSADGTCANPLLSQQQQQKVSVEMYSMRSDPVGAPLVVAATGAHSHPAYTIVRLYFHCVYCRPFILSCVVFASLNNSAPCSSLCRFW